MAALTDTPRAKKSLGQHFLIDESVAFRIVQFAAVGQDETVIEIGPGLGHLTRLLLESGARVTGVEFDRDMVLQLRKQWPPEKSSLQVVQANILTLDWLSILPAHPVKVVGNLPYNISSRIIRETMRVKHRFQSLVFMLQREMARRLLARPGDSDYGLFSVLSHFHFDCEFGFDVPAGAFRPRPSVVSSVLRLVPRPEPVGPLTHRRLEALLRQAFRHPRKTIFNNLKASKMDPKRIEAALEECGIESRQRPQDVDLEAFGCLARVL